MNRQDLTNSGGHPLTLDDLHYHLQNDLDTIYGLSSCLRGYASNDIIILSGCVVTELAGNFTHTDGWVLVDGEVFYVPAKLVGTAIALGTPTYNILINEVVDPAGTKTYYSGAIIDTRFSRTASVFSNNGATATTFSEANRFNKILLQNLSTPFRSVGAVGEPAYQNLWAGSAKIRKTKTGKMQLHGAIAHASMSGVQRTIWTLAAADRPIVDKYFAVAGLEGGTPTSHMVFIEAATGDVEVFGGNNGVSKSLYLNAIEWDLD